MKEMKKLIRLLNEASMAYYQQDKEIMSDFEYDRLYDKLVKLEEQTGIVLSNSPTQRVGYQVLSSLKKVQHESKMLSLDKTKEIGALESFLGNNAGVLSYKMDGLTVVLTYREGKLVQAVTRGNGEIGEDITHNAKLFKNIPLKIAYTDNLIVRGEAVISFKDFQAINEEMEPENKFKNPRNLCSGAVRQLNSEISAKRNVNFIAFSLVGGGNNSNSKLERLKWLEGLGFQIVESVPVTNETIAAAVIKFQKKIPNNVYATDGLVLTFDDIAYSEGLGATAKFPRDSIAFKWQDEVAETTLLNIEWNTSRTGLINPVAVFEPVELEGTTVNRASLHNLSIVENFKLGIGDKITVYKANMIIPQLADNLTQSNTFVVPKVCNVCNTPTVVTSLRDGKALKCPNPNCKAQLVFSLSHFASRDAMNIEGFSEATVEKFVEMGFINDYADIYYLDRFRSEIISMEGFGEKSYNNLIDAIENSKQVELPNFIYSLGINNVGLSNARLLCKRFDYDLNKIMSATLEQLNEIDGFGEVRAKSVYDYFNKEENIDILNKILNMLRFKTINNQESDKKLEGKTFVITGDVYVYKNRKELQQHIEQLGGKATGSVSAKTDYLINNDVNSSSSKNKKAKELGVPIISEQAFIDMIQ